MYDPLVTSYDNLPGTVMVELPGTLIGWLIPIVNVPAGLSSLLTKFWCFFIYNIAFFLLSDFFGVD